MDAMRSAALGRTVPAASAKCWKTGDQVRGGSGSGSSPIDLRGSDANLTKSDRLANRCLGSKLVRSVLAATAVEHIAIISQLWSQHGSADCDHT